MDMQYDTLAFFVEEYVMKRYMVVDSDYIGICNGKL